MVHVVLYKCCCVTVTWLLTSVSLSDIFHACLARSARVMEFNSLNITNPIPRSFFYVEQRYEREQQKNDYRVVVLGGAATGKSSLVLRFVNGTFRERHFPTVEDIYCQVNIYIGYFIFKRSKWLSILKRSFKTKLNGWYKVLYSPDGVKESTTFLLSIGFSSSVKSFFFFHFGLKTFSAH